MNFIMNITLTSTQRQNFDFLLFLTGRLLDLTGVIIGLPIGGAEGVEVGLRTVNVAHTPKGRESKTRHVNGDTTTL